MKTTKLLMILIAILSLHGCCLLVPCDTDDDFIDPDFSLYEPIIMTREELENSIQLTASQSILTSGKIYIKNNLLIINEVRKGFHFYDNSDPTNPTPLKFLEVPGATDVAIRDNVLYINQATDLIAVQYDDKLNTIEVTKRIINTFPEILSPDGIIFTTQNEDEVVIDWKLTDESNQIL